MVETREDLWPRSGTIDLTVWGRVGLRGSRWKDWTDERRIDEDLFRRLRPSITLPKVF